MKLTLKGVRATAPELDPTDSVDPSSPGVSRRAVFAGAAFGVVAAASSGLLAAAPAAASASVVMTGDNGRNRSTIKDLTQGLQEVLEAWGDAPGSHPMMGDWRQVGYRRGTTDPKPTSQKVVEARRLGITPDQEQDAGAAIQKALDDLGAAGGGILQLDRGRYVVNQPLFMRDSNVVLRGAGTDQTTLYFPRTLREALGAGGVNWSWTGGQIFFISRERFAKSMQTDWAPEVSEGWLPGEVLATVAPADRGTSVLMVNDTSLITPGDMVLLDVDNPTDYRLLKEMAGNIAGADAYNWGVDGRRIANPTAFEDLLTWRWPVVVSEILSSRTVRLEQPLRIAIHRQTPARLLALGPTVHDSGVEDLTIENKLITQTAHNANPGSNGVCFQAVHDCWAKNIHVLNADVAFGMTCAKSCTLSGISAGGRSLHHFVACRTTSHDNLVEDFVLEEFTVPAATGSYLHGINLEGLSSGNVYRRGVLNTGTFDSHRQLPFENLRTNITVTNKDSVVGGAFDAGPFFGARTVHWGVTVTNNKNIGIEVSDVAPRSLTAGIVGLTAPGSGGLNTPFLKGSYAGDLESERLEFGADLGRSTDLLDIQRAFLPLAK